MMGCTELVATLHDRILSLLRDNIPLRSFRSYVPADFTLTICQG